MKAAERHHHKAVELFAEADMIHKASRLENDLHNRLKKLEQSVNKTKEAIAESRKGNKVQAKIIETQRKNMLWR